MTESKRGGSAGGAFSEDNFEKRGSNSGLPNAHYRERKGKRQLGAPRFAALDLGTNNCRLLIAAPRGRDLRIVDAFSRIVRLGEGVSRTGLLSDVAMERAISALKACRVKIDRRAVTHMRCIATQACRGASNGAAFLECVQAETGLEFEIISTEEEARLAVAGCSELIDNEASAGLIFDIGGGSTELSWVQRHAKNAVVEAVAWTSLPFGVVSLSEKWDGRSLGGATYKAIVEEVRGEISKIGDPAGIKSFFRDGRAHLLGTSGTVTSIAGVHLGLKRYRRDKVDGLWLSSDQTRDVSENLRKMSFAERAEEPCIGEDRADLVVCGCAILEALLLEWPTDRIRVADRGLREGILVDLSREARKERRRRQPLKS